MGPRRIVFSLVILPLLVFGSEHLQETTRDKIRLNEFMANGFDKAIPRRDSDLQLVMDFYPQGFRVNSIRPNANEPVSTIRVRGHKKLSLYEYISLVSQSLGYSHQFADEPSKEISVTFSDQEISLDSLGEFLLKNTDYKLLVYTESRLISVVKVLP